MQATNEEGGQLLLFILAGLAAVALAAIGRAVWATRRLTRVTEDQRRALGESDEALALLNTLLSNAPDGLGFLDRALRYQRVNQSLAALNGVSVEKHIGRTIGEVLPDLAPRLEPLLQRILETGEPIVDMEISGETPASPGQRRHWLASYYPVRTPNGHLLGIGSVVIDITERKQAEEAQKFLAEVSTVLAGSLDYQTTLESVAQLAVPQVADWCAVDVVTEDGRLERMGATHTDAKKVAAVMELHRRAPPSLDEPRGVPKVLRTGQPEIYPESAEVSLGGHARDERLRELLTLVGYRSVMVVPILARGRTLGAITFASSGSGRRFGPEALALAEKLARRAAVAIENARLYREIQVGLRESRAALVTRDEFLSMASHELKTPLTALKGQVQLAGRRLRRGAVDQVDELIEQADVQVDRLGALVRDLLDVSRIAAGGFAVERKPIQLRRLIERAVTLERSAAPERTITLDLPEELPVVYADAERLEQVLVNLLENAQKYSSVETEIHVRAVANDGVISIAVEDQGVGIPRRSASASSSDSTAPATLTRTSPASASDSTSRSRSCGRTRGPSRSTPPPARGAPSP